MSFCRVSILGNLGADPETRYTPNGAMNVQFNVAVNPPRRRNDTADPPPTWYRITAWGELAERVDKMVQQGFIARGRSLYIEGALEPRQFTGNDGTTRWSFDVRMSNFEFTGGGRDQQDGQGGGGYSGQTGSGPQNQGNNSGYGQRDRNSNPQGGSPYDDDPGPTNIDDVPF